MLGLLLIVIELCRSVPAWTAVRRNQTADGLSPTGLGIETGVGAGWTVLAVATGEPWVLAATIIWSVLHVGLCVEVARVQHGAGRSLLLATAVSGALFTAATAALTPALSLVTALGLLLAATGLAYGVPALWAGLRSETTCGVSPTALATNTVEAVVYIVIGLGIGATAGQPIAGYVWFGLIGAGHNMPRLVRVLWRRSRGLDRPSPPMVGSAAPAPQP